MNEAVRLSKLQCPSKRVLESLKGTDEGPDVSRDASVEFYTEKEGPFWWNVEWAALTASQSLMQHPKK